MPDRLLLSWTLCHSVLQVQLIDALKEIEAHEPDVQQLLSSEYKYILQNADTLRTTYKRQPSYLERLYGSRSRLAGVSFYYLEQ